MSRGIHPSSEVPEPESSPGEVAPDRMSRRGVLRGAATAGAGLGLGSLIAPAPAVAAPALPAPDPAAASSAGAAPTPTADGIPPELLARIRAGERFRLRELGIAIGDIPTGKFNAITDVPGIKVGYKTLIHDEPGIARTGVTVIVPRDDIKDNNCYAAFFSHNGNGEMTGTHWVTENGLLTSNIGITNTAQVGLVRDTLVKLQAEADPTLTWALPVATETWDGKFNDINRFWLTENDVREAVASARSGVPDEGNVGGGTGMSFMGWKGGSGTSSRQVRHGADTYTVGVFVQSNFGKKDDLRVNGAPVGKDLPEPGKYDVPNGKTKSCIIIVATDAPLLADQCRRLAVRAANGLAAVGGIASDGDGDIYFAFSTGNSIPAESEEPSANRPTALSGRDMDPFFRATIDATQEALINSGTKAQTLAGLNGRVKYAIPLEPFIQSVQYHRV
ncbi:P1 family peptidase [Pseudonocardia phyllosphaerae]|uniref:P1 family peptidase n=1 Tax=Pseudonocardia phyllosphaerae TaxID=3390502 RepID=UPI00397A0D08